VNNTDVDDEGIIAAIGGVIRKIFDFWPFFTPALGRLWAE